MMRPNLSYLAETRPASTMPRPTTEAAAYLNLYKLTIEKKRLQHELETLEVRRLRLQKRLAFLSSQVAELDRNAAAEPQEAPAQEPTPENKAFNTLFLEY